MMPVVEDTFLQPDQVGADLVFPQLSKNLSQQSEQPSFHGVGLRISYRCVGNRQLRN